MKNKRNLLSIILVLLNSFWVCAQTDVGRVDKWSFTARFVMTGSSDRSDPVGYEVYSAFSFCPVILRSISKSFDLEFNIRFESHEIDFYPVVGIDQYESLGSIELIPANFLLRFNIINNDHLKFYTGVGVNATFCMEKSGKWDTYDLSPSIGPALQLGSDISLSHDLLLNVNLGWNGLKTDVTDNDKKVVTLNMDPIILGVGLGYLF